ncbi:hypothetical protein Pelo_19296 [Pelomyxa schiedti]|nr:hypothetical protein Pelo_19296 [Pelomyxa schiedti]
MFHTSDLTTPCARGYRHKQVPGSTDGSTMWITMVLECGILRTSVRYPVTDAETDTLLAAITYNAPGRPRQLSDPDEFDLALELS